MGAPGLKQSERAWLTHKEPRCHHVARPSASSDPVTPSPPPLEPWSLRVKLIDRIIWTWPQRGPALGAESSMQRKPGQLARGGGPAGRVDMGAHSLRRGRVWRGAASGPAAAPALLLSSSCEMERSQGWEWGVGWDRAGAGLEVAPRERIW